MEALTISIEEKTDLKNTYIANFDGAFDGSVKEPLEELNKLILSNDSAIQVVLDFTKLSFLNSYAIGQLMSWYNHIHKNEGEMIVVNSNKNIEEILNIVGASKLFKIFPTVDEAMQHIK